MGFSKRSSCASRTSTWSSDLRREKAAAEEANAAKSRFLAAASHDLRQPVHALSLFVAAAQVQPINPETRSLLDHIDDSVRSLSRLFGGLLDISRLDAGVVEVNRLSFAVRPVIHNVFQEFAARAERERSAAARAGSRTWRFTAIRCCVEDQVRKPRQVRDCIG